MLSYTQSPMNKLAIIWFRRNDAFDILCDASAAIIFD